MLYNVATSVNSCLGTSVFAPGVVHGRKPVGSCGLNALTEATVVTGHGRRILCKAAQNQMAQAAWGAGHIQKGADLTMDAAWGHCLRSRIDSAESASAPLHHTGK